MRPEAFLFAFLLAGALVPGTDPFPAAAANCTARLAVVSVAWDDQGPLAVQGVVARITFPASLGFDARTGPAGAVENRTGLDGGLFDAAARDADGDGALDTLTIGLVGSGVPAGDFARVRFACRGDRAPRETDFGCSLEAATAQGDVAGTCRVRFEPVPTT